MKPEQPYLSDILFARTPVYDALHQSIDEGCIVAMHVDASLDIDGGSFTDYEGVVVSPRSVFQGDTTYTVPVFFPSEVPDHLFHRYGNEIDPNMISLSDWNKDTRYQVKATSPREFSFLWTDEDGSLWRRCPRIHYFQPSELKVCADFSMKNLANRIFPHRWHSCYSPIKHGFSHYLDGRICDIAACKNIAEHITLYNVWGTVGFCFTCKTCHSNYNGTCSDTGPDLKKK
jgi:hypothetical protein